MADDQFTAQLEWLCRLRKEAGCTASLIRRVRKFLMLAGSTQNEGCIRLWVNPEVEQMHEDLERLLAILDPATARYLEGPVVRHGGYLPQGTAGAMDLNEKPGTQDVTDTRSIKGPGRRHGYRHA